MGDRFLLIHVVVVRVDLEIKMYGVKKINVNTVWGDFSNVT